MDFNRSIEALREWRKKPSDTAFPMFLALCQDLSPGSSLESETFAYEAILNAGNLSQSA